ncbi:phosphoribosylaminoimidazole synthetase [Candidatus Magnetobacterium bavaricum]|uniref:Phosphoribosylformylglycinamidine cyclo-ligase n=1 Tax=Candidatus Magnetobacterium bavaricum TaxID=29290 RepID=A0A0F3GUS4_9BACT|nr:phosphoribosylaminoimidazole synthetase [Candidatus Magnetobacterium bavaricum]
MNNTPLTYKDAGVNVAQADAFINEITPMVRSTFRKEVLTDIGAFYSLFRVDLARYNDPVLVSSTDGVGTKLKIAFMLNKHDTIGIDLVAMCANDILTAGAEPLFFLDYLAVAALEPAVAVEILRGITEGCLQAGCSLVGGETAEMPGFYARHEYDISGFVVGILNRGDVLDHNNVKVGDTVIGLASTGLHSNGYSLVRRLFFDINKLDVNTHMPGLDKTLGQELLTPTKIYVKTILSARKTLDIKAMAHITGGGLTGNLPRVLPQGHGIRIKLNSWDVPPIFQLVQKMGNVDTQEMFKTFNMGIGYVIITPQKDSKKALELLSQSGQQAHIIGEVIKGSGIVYH